MRLLFLFILFVVVSFNALALQIESSVIEGGGYIPDRYTCDSKNYSPPLSWSDVPKGTESFALVVDDSDAPAGIWVHWLVYDIPTSVVNLEENVSKTQLEQLGISQGRNDFGQPAYGGPCPPEGPAHKYLFKLYALDKKLSLPEGVSKSELITQIQGHIIAEAKLSCYYQRPQESKGEENGKN